MDLFAERLKAARILNGYSLQNLADALNNKITKQTLHNYEKGQSEPNAELLQDLCKILKINQDFFTHKAKVEFGTIEFRKLQKFSVKEKNKVIELTRDKLERYIELEDLLALPNNFHNPIKDFEINSAEDIETAAQIVRDHWKAGIDPINNVIELLEDNHIKVIEIETEDGFDGLQTWVNDTIPVIVLNSAKLKSLDRKRFTALHELAHLFLVGLDKFSERDKEKLCHRFAGAILFPPETAISEFGNKRSNFHINELGLLKMQYGISMQALVYRAKDLEFVSENYVRQFMFHMTQMGYKIQEPFEYKGYEESNRFMQLIYRALAEDIISIEKAAQLSNASIAKLRGL